MHCDGRIKVGAEFRRDAEGASRTTGPASPPTTAREGRLGDYRCGDAYC